MPHCRLGETVYSRLGGTRLRGAIVVSSNRSYGERRHIFSDQVLASALLGRLLHHSVTINIRGEPYRLKDKRKAGIFRAPDTPVER